MKGPGDRYLTLRGTLPSALLLPVGSGLNLGLAQLRRREKVSCPRLATMLALSAQCLC